MVDIYFLLLYKYIVSTLTIKMQQKNEKDVKIC